MKRFYIVIAIALLTAISVTPAPAEDGEWSFSVDTTFTSQYLWRGFVLNDSPSLQPNITVGYKGFSVSSWSNFASRAPNNQAWTEHDLTVDYSHGFSNGVGVSFGYTLYTFPDIASGRGNRSHEIYAGVSYEGPLNPSFTYYRDVDQGDGNYFYLSGGHSWGLGKGMVLNGGAGLGLNNKQWIDVTTVSNFDINVSVDIPAGKLVFSPFFTQMIGNSSIFGNHNAYGVNLSVVSFNW